MASSRAPPLQCMGSVDERVMAEALTNLVLKRGSFAIPGFFAGGSARATLWFTALPASLNSLPQVAFSHKRACLPHLGLLPL
jgi:hypothetical protein